MGEHRVGRQAHFLGALDLGVPIGALDQAAHQAHPVLACQRGEVLNELQRAGLVGLQGQAKAGPLWEMLGHALDQSAKHLQRELEAVHLFGINRQVDIGAGRLLAQAPDARHQFIEHTRTLRVFVAGMQGAELDGNAVVVLGRAAAVGVAGNEGNGLVVAVQVAQGIGIGARTFAQHVIGVREPPRSLTACGRCPPRGLLRLGAAQRRNVQVFPARRIGLLHRLGHGLAQHELAAQQLHCAQGRGHHGLGAQLGHDAGLGLRTLAGLRVRQEVLGQGNGSARQPRHHLVAAALKVGPAQLVCGQGDGGFGVRNAQQRFGQAHQGQALGAGDGVFAQQAFHGPEGRRIVAHGLHPGAGRLGGSRPVQTGVDHLQLACHHLVLGAVGKRQLGLDQQDRLLDLAINAILQD